MRAIETAVYTFPVYTFYVYQDKDYGEEIKEILVAFVKDGE